MVEHRERWCLAAALCLAAMLMMVGCKGNEKEKQDLRLQGIEQLEAERYEEAIDSFESALELSKGVVGEFELDVLKYRAEAEYKAGDYQAASYTYEVLMQVDKELPEYQTRICMLEALAGDLDQAQEEYKKLYALQPDSPDTAEILLVLGQALTDAERYDEAISLYQQAVDDGMQSGEIYNRMGVCQLEAGDLDGAIQYLEQGIATGDETVMKTLRRNLAASYEKKQDFGRAMSLLEQYQAAYGADPDVQKEIEFLKTR